MANKKTAKKTSERMKTKRRRTEVTLPYLDALKKRINRLERALRGVKTR